MARQIAREQLVSEKAERQAVREAQKVQKAAEAARHREEVDEQRAQRMRLAETKKTAVQSKKRALEEREENQPKKRVRTDPSRSRNAADSHGSRRKLDSTVVDQSSRTIAGAEHVLGGRSGGNESEVSISQSGRMGRTVRLPERFR